MEPGVPHTDRLSNVRCRAVVGALGSGLDGGPGVVLDLDVDRDGLLLRVNETDDVCVGTACAKGHRKRRQLRLVVAVVGARRERVWDPKILFGVTASQHRRQNGAGQVLGGSR